MSIANEDRARSAARSVRHDLLALMLAHALSASLLLYALYRPEPKLEWVGLYGIIVTTPVGLLMTLINVQEIWTGEFSFGALVGILAVLVGAGWLIWFLV